MYKLILDITQQNSCVVERLSDSAFIPFAPANTDYQRFKSDVLKGAELQDADGVAMSAADAKAYVKTLP